jgi:hypothetical protein
MVVKLPRLDLSNTPCAIKIYLCKMVSAGLDGAAHMHPVPWFIYDSGVTTRRQGFF